MSDPTTARVTIATADLWQAEEIFGERLHELSDPEEREDGTISFTLKKADRGGEFDVDALQEEGIPVIVDHGAGETYPAGSIAFDGIERAQCAMLRRGVAVRFLENRDGVPPEELIAARRYFAIRNRALAVMHARSIAA